MSRTGNNAWIDVGTIATDSHPLPPWVEGALGLLSLNVGEQVNFATDEPVVVRKYSVTASSSSGDNKDWRKRDDLAWCNAWACDDNVDEIRVWERFYPAGTHTLDTSYAFFSVFHAGGQDVSGKRSSRGAGVGVRGVAAAALVCNGFLILCFPRRQSRNHSQVVFFLVCSSCLSSYAHVSSIAGHVRLTIHFNYKYSRIDFFSTFVRLFILAGFLTSESPLLQHARVVQQE